MAQIKDTHIVEIPVDTEHNQKHLSTMDTFTAIQHHPLMEISRSPGHLLLLKLWQREEELFGRRISIKESRMDSIKTHIFQLCCFYVVFHGIWFTLLFTSSVNDIPRIKTCVNWWIPSLIQGVTAFVFVLLVQVKVCRYWKVCRQLQRERNDSRSLTRCIQELRMKGASFDLSKEPSCGKKMKSSSVEIKWKPITWFSQNLITISLMCLSKCELGLVVRMINQSSQGNAASRRWTPCITGGAASTRRLCALQKIVDAGHLVSSSS
ncbi:hypothetical protein ACFE04_023687 [Oxalis oulophora]